MQIEYTQNKYIYNLFLFLFSIIPISILIGPSISLFNILVIDIFFIILIIKSNNYSFLKNKNFRFLLILFIYLLFNTLISLDFSLSLSRNLGFIRILILFLAFNYFFLETKFLNKVLFIWSIIFIIVIIDIYFEFFIGKNLLGFNDGTYGNRIVSFFKDEPVVGSYVNGFYLIILGFLSNQYKRINKDLLIFFSLVILFSVILTGERASTIKLVLSLILFFAFISSIDIKKKIIYFFIGLLITSITIINTDYLKLRFIKQITKVPIKENLYIKIYQSGYEVFKEYPYFGTGNKNYRTETCKINQQKFKNNKYLCQTHPHQVYLEFLSEHGIFGFILIFYVFYKLIFSKISKIITNRNYIQIGSLLYLIMIFLPIIPSGAFFGDFLLTLFAINLSILYSSDPSLNIFDKENKQ